VLSPICKIFVTLTVHFQTNVASLETSLMKWGPNRAGPTLSTERPIVDYWKLYNNLWNMVLVLLACTQTFIALREIDRTSCFCEYIQVRYYESICVLFQLSIQTFCSQNIILCPFHPQSPLSLWFETMFRNILSIWWISEPHWGYVLFKNKILMYVELLRMKKKPICGWYHQWNSTSLVKCECPNCFKLFILIFESRL